MKTYNLLDWQAHIFQLLFNKEKPLDRLVIFADRKVGKTFFAEVLKEVTKEIGCEIFTYDKSGILMYSVRCEIERRLKANERIVIFLKESEFDIFNETFNRKDWLLYNVLGKGYPRNSMRL